MPEELPSESETAMLKALSHETRRRIMRAILGKDEVISPRELSEALGQRLSGISYHVRVLAAANAITLDHTEPVRGSSEHFYRPSEAFKGLNWASDMLLAPAKAAA